MLSRAEIRQVSLCSSRQAARQCVLTHFLTATYHHAMRTQTVNIAQAKNQLAELIAWAAEDGEILIIDNGKAVARLVPPGEAAAYRAHPPSASEFSTDKDSLAWDADGWENVA
jgi:prevent-host-death family protein